MPDTMVAAPGKARQQYTLQTWPTYLCPYVWLQRWQAAVPEGEVLSIDPQQPQHHGIDTS